MPPRPNRAWAGRAPLPRVFGRPRHASPSAQHHNHARLPGHSWAGGDFDARYIPDSVSALVDPRGIFRADNSATERNAGDLGLNVSAGDAHAWVMSLSSDWRHHWSQQGALWTWEAGVRLEHDFNATPEAEHSLAVQSQLTQTGSAVVGIDRGANGASAHLRLSAQWGASSTAALSYRFSQWPHGPQGQIGLHWAHR